MNWTNIRLIAAREIRDQLRDRRTIFVIAILPLLLYPLLGMSFLQVMQFLREHPTKVWVIGANALPEGHRLLRDAEFRVELLDSPTNSRLFEVSQADPQEDVIAEANAAVRSGKYDAVIYLPPTLTEEVAKIAADEHNPEEAMIGGPEVFCDMARDKSRVAHDRLMGILSRWRASIMNQHLAAKVQDTITDPAVAKSAPLVMVRHDLSHNSSRQAATWSKLLPLIIIVWAMTGAFYPAIDLCAGEKERGTLETLLSSPASRHEIVFGKLLTVMVFSIATSLLNLLSMGLTGKFVFSQLQALGDFGGLQIGPPPIESLFWVVLVLFPIAALFSGLSLALAAMARSSKEGQYYLMPLMLGTMPLMMLPMLPAMELDLGNSLIPVTGVILLLRSLMEGHYMEALRYSIPVISVTGMCCWLAGMWAISQFEDENVLFHESEQISLKSWLVHVFRDRTDTPTIAQAFFCAVILLILRFFGSLLLPTAADWNGLLIQNTIAQIGFIAGPAIVMAWFLTRKPSTSLLLERPQFQHILLAALLAVVAHPVVSSLANAIQTLYPVSEATMAKLESFQSLLLGAPSMLSLLLMVAVLPAICEELAFRGFILSGLRKMKNTTLAVLVSSLLFGIAHQMLQQSIAAFCVGVMIGFLSIQTRSIFPCMVYHLIHNSLPLLAASGIGKIGNIRGFVQIEDGMLQYEWPLVSICVAAVILILMRIQEQGQDIPQHEVPAMKVAPSS